MIEKTYIKLCEICARVCLFTLFQVPGSLEEVKCGMCKKKRPCNTYEVKLRGEKE